jgi:iron complex outermembrane receptor protein
MNSRQGSPRLHVRNPSNLRRAVRRATAGLLASGLLCGVAYPQEATQPTDAAHRAIIDEVVVTARKRNEQIQDVPMSVSAVGAQDLEEGGYTMLKDIGFLFPNVSFNDSNGSGASLSIRGLESDAFGGDASVGLYLDEVYVGSEGTLGQRIVDIERIEVLRGPQGTLFGRNTVAGAINVTSVKPSAEPEFKLDATYGSYDLVSLRAVASGPLASDRLFGRITAAHRTRDGQLENRLGGPAGNDQDGQSARAQVLFVPADSLELLLSLDASRDRTFDNLFDITGANALGRDPDGYDRVSEWSPRGFNDRDIWGASVRATYTVDDLTVTSISALRSTKGGFLSDRDFTSIPILETGSKSNDDSFSQELRLSTSHEKGTNWVLGLYYFGLDDDRETDVHILEGFLGPGLRDDVVTKAHTQTWSAAIFGNLDFALSDTTNLELGARYTHDQRDLSYEQTAALPIPGFLPVPLFTDSVSNGELTPTATLRYKASENFMTYVRYARGYKSAGFNSGPSANPDQLVYKPEFVDSAEIGFKSDLLNQRLRLNLTAFYLEYKDIQLSELDFSGGFVSNAAEATSKGAELEIKIAPTAGLQLAAGIGYTDASFKKFLDRTGNRLPRAPKWTASFVGEYQWALTSGVDAFARGEAAYRSENFIDTSNSSIFEQPSHTVVNARFGIQSSNGRWQVAAWGRNLTNEDYLLSGFSLPFANYITIAEPRSYGVDVSFHY